MNLIKFDKDMNIKDIDENNNECYTILQFTNNENCNSVYCSHLLYINCYIKYKF